MGTSEADCDGKYKPHLHVTYFPKIDKSKTYIYKSGQKLIKTSEYNSISLKTKRNPFIHDSEAKGDNVL